MLRHKFFCLLFFMTMGFSLHANCLSADCEDEYCNTWCNSCCDCGRFMVRGEYLYLRPLVEQSFFVVSNTVDSEIATANGTRFNNQFHWHSAYRVLGSYNFCNNCNDLEFRWTYLKTHRNRSLTSDPAITAGFLTTQGYPLDTIGSFTGEANSSIRLKYYAADALFGQAINCNCCCFNLAIKGGAHFARVRLSENIEYITTESTNQVNNRTRFWGVGPELEIDMQYRLPSFGCCCIPLSFVGNFRTALLITKSQINFSSGLNDVFTADVTNEDLWHLFPMWDLRFGLAYHCCCRCFVLSIEAGYEALSYHKAIQTIRFYEGGSPGASFDLFSNLDFHGPYAALSLGF